MATETHSAFPRLEDSFNNKCGITLSDSIEGSAIVEVMRNKPGVEIVEYPAMFRIDGIGRLEFDMAEISEALGRDFDPYDFQVEMATHYGKMVLLDDKVLLFADPDEAKQYLTVGGKWFSPQTEATAPAGA